METTSHLEGSYGPGANLRRRRRGGLPRGSPPLRGTALAAAVATYRTMGAASPKAEHLSISLLVNQLELAGHDVPAAPSPHPFTGAAH